MPSISKILHYCFGLSADFGFKPWSLVHYACLKSAVTRIDPKSVLFHYEYEPSGPWWEITRPLVSLNKIQAPRFIFGNPIEKVAHRADVLRLEMLLKYGGIYLDADVLVLRDFDDLLSNRFVIAEEGPEAAHGLSNAVLLSEAASSFATRWYEEYRSFHGDRSWTEHSIQLPLQLARRFPNEVTVLPYTAFAWPLHYEKHLRWIFEPEQADIATPAYTRHLWESLAWSRYLENLTPGHIRRANSNFAKWIAPFVADLPDDFGQKSIFDRYYNKSHRIWSAIQRRLFST